MYLTGQVTIECRRNGLHYVLKLRPSATMFLGQIIGLFYCGEDGFFVLHSSYRRRFVSPLPDPDWDFAARWESRAISRGTLSRGSPLGCTAPIFWRDGPVNGEYLPR